MKNKKFIYLGCIFILFVLAKLINPLIIQKISLVNYDFYQNVLIKGEVENITIVDIDEKSLSIIGQFPWRRDIYATILDNLNKHNPGSIAFDIFFSEKDKQNPKNLLIELQKDNEELNTLSVIDTNKIFVIICL